MLFGMAILLNLVKWWVTDGTRILNTQNSIHTIWHISRGNCLICSAIKILVSQRIQLIITLGFSNTVGFAVAVEGSCHVTVCNATQTPGAGNTELQQEWVVMNTREWRTKTGRLKVQLTALKHIKQDACTQSPVDSYSADYTATMFYLVPSQ